METEALIVLGQFLGYSIAWIIGVYIENTDKRIGRFEFTRWLIGLTVLNIIASVILSGIFNTNSMSMLITGLIADMIIIGACFFVFAKVVVQRFRDINWDKYAAYLFMLPIMNIFLLIVLCFKAGTEPSSPFDVVNKNNT